MASTDTPELRIFCLCGQKMKVAADMYGRRGKCIACRQKIRIPLLEELEDGVREIHLRDHPEFLRKPSVPKELTIPPSSPPTDEVPLGDSAHATVVPVDPLEPLRELCSFEQEIARQVEVLRTSGAEKTGPVGMATLEGYRVLVENIRNDLDEQMREHLGKVSQRLKEVEDQILKTSLGTRAGEIDFASFARIVGPLRQHREFLVRRRHNLRGWLATSDPNLVGGRIAVKLEDIPCERMELVLPTPPKDPLPMVDSHLEALREAMNEREDAERKLVTWKRMQQEDALPADSLDDSVDAYRAIRARASARLNFHHQRMNQAIKDCDNDIKAVKSHLELLRARFQSNMIDKAAYQSQETALIRAQTELAQSREVAREALRAERAVALPAARRSFVKRLVKQQRGDGLGKDCWPAWLGAALMLLNISVDISPQQLTGNLVALSGLTLLLFATAVFVSVSAAIPQRRLRGGAYLLLGLVYLVGVTACLESAYFGLGIVGGAMRTSKLWFASPGVLLLFASYVLVQIAGGVALRREEGHVRAVGWSFAIGLVAAGIAGSSLLGLHAAKPVVLDPETGLYSRASGGYGVVFTVENRGFRPFWYGGLLSQLPTPVSFDLEQETAPGQWRAVEGPQSVRHSDWTAPRETGSGVQVNPGEQLKLRYTLPPGEYRYRISGPRGVTGSFQRLPLLPSTLSSDIEDLLSARPATSGLGAGSENLPHVRVQLRGLMDSQTNLPLFKLQVTPPGEPAREINVRLGESVSGPWIASEYNPERKTLTLTNGEVFLLLATGESLDLPVSPKPQTATAPE